VQLSKQYPTAFGVRKHTEKSLAERLLEHQPHETFSDLVEQRKFLCSLVVNVNIIESIFGVWSVHLPTELEVGLPVDFVVEYVPDQPLLSLEQLRGVILEYLVL
jgi:hypothetical protein